MPIENETKFEVDDFDEIVPKLLKLGAKLIWKGNEKTFFFDFPNRRLKKAHTLVRLREWPGHSCSITSKTKVLGKLSKKNKHKYQYKRRDENQLEAPSIKIGRKFLESIGLVETFYYTKRREHWEIGKAFVELDIIEEGGKKRYFVEIEASRKIIPHLTKRIGLSWNRVVTEGYVTIIKQMKAQK